MQRIQIEDFQYKSHSNENCHIVSIIFMEKYELVILH